MFIVDLLSRQYGGTSGIEICRLLQPAYVKMPGPSAGCLCGSLMVLSECLQVQGARCGNRTLRLAGLGPCLQSAAFFAERRLPLNDPRLTYVLQPPRVNHTDGGLHVCLTFHLRTSLPREPPHQAPALYLMETPVDLGGLREAVIMCHHAQLEPMQPPGQSFRPSCGFLCEPSQHGNLSAHVKHSGQ